MTFMCKYYKFHRLIIISTGVTLVFVTAGMSAFAISPLTWNTATTQRPNLTLRNQGYISSRYEGWSDYCVVADLRFPDSRAKTASCCWASPPTGPWWPKLLVDDDHQQWKFSDPEKTEQSVSTNMELVHPSSGTQFWTTLSISTIMKLVWNPESWFPTGT